MTVTNDEITKIIDMIIVKINNLEKNQIESKSTISNIKSKLVELNEFVNDIIDIIENDNYYESDEHIMKKINKFKDLSDIIDDSIESNDIDGVYLKAIKGEIIGES
mgnify:CR=1 FL=1